MPSTSPHCGGGGAVSSADDAIRVFYLVERSAALVGSAGAGERLALARPVPCGQRFCLDALECKDDEVALGVRAKPARTQHLAGAQVDAVGDRVLEGRQLAAAKAAATDDNQQRCAIRPCAGR